MPASRQGVTGDIGTKSVCYWMCGQVAVVKLMHAFSFVLGPISWCAKGAVVNYSDTENNLTF